MIANLELPNIGKSEQESKEPDAFLGKQVNPQDEEEW